MRYSGLIILVASFSILVSSPAFAYVDPISGSIVAQLIGSGWVGLVAVGTIYRRRLKQWFADVVARFRRK